MDCPRCGIEMHSTYYPYEGYCDGCHLLFDFYTGKEIMTERSLTSYEQLQLENQRLREALTLFAEFQPCYGCEIPEDYFEKAKEALRFSAIGMTTETVLAQTEIQTVNPVRENDDPFNRSCPFPNGERVKLAVEMKNAGGILVGDPGLVVRLNGILTIRFDREPGFIAVSWDGWLVTSLCVEAK